MRVGDLTVVPVLDGTLRLRPTTLYQGTTDADWEPHRALLADDGQLELPLGSFVVRGARDHVVLVDVGVGGEGQSPVPFLRGGELLTSLAAVGVRPGDVTDVVFTHLHFDHIGWATVDGAPAFPNATYRCDARDWAHFVDARSDGSPYGAGSGRERLAPIADRFVRWDCGGPILPGIDVLEAPGHTPGSTIVVVSSGEERALLLGDVAHCPIELTDTEWQGIGDVDPALARRTREALARELEGSDVPITAAHFPGLRFGRLLRAAGRRQWVVP